ncbi:MAG: SAM-dependent methyltransferase, partial [Proteobacteria bacterium]|nr:SAM-dependent methyltransferase [Pseudomonadota bacterium]
MDRTMDAPVQDRRPGGLGRPFAWIGRRVLARIDRGIVSGAIAVSLPGDVPRRLGGRAPGPEAVVILHSWRSLWRLV